MNGVKRIAPGAHATGWLMDERGRASAVQDTSSDNCTQSEEEI